MPFRSERQRRYLHAHELALAARWEREYGSKPKKRAPAKKRSKKKR